MIQLRQYATEVKRTLDQLPWQAIERVIESLYSAWLADKQVFVMGNGGSASTASHMACDLGKNTVTPGVRRLRVMSLNDNMAHFSAYANDNGYDQVFAEQLTNYANEGDVVVAISASGNSPNVLRAIERAREYGALTIGWSGYQGGKLAKIVDMPVVIPSNSIEQIEDIHLMLEHMVTVALRQAIRDHAAAQPALAAPDGRQHLHANGYAPQVAQTVS